MNLKDLLEILPSLLSYFIPGAVAIELYDILFLKKQEHTAFTFWSVVLSYIIKLVADSIWNNPQNSLGNIAISIIAPLLFYFLSRFKLFGIDSIFGVTTSSNIWLKVLDFDENNYIVAHLIDGKSYIGTIYSVDNDWLILKDYYSADGKSDNDCKQILCIPTSKIDRFEYAYDKDSKKLKEFYPFD